MNTSLDTDLLLSVLVDLARVLLPGLELGIVLLHLLPELVEVDSALLLPKE